MHQNGHTASHNAADYENISKNSEKAILSKSMVMGWFRYVAQQTDRTFRTPEIPDCNYLGIALSKWVIFSRLKIIYKQRQQLIGVGGSPKRGKTKKRRQHACAFSSLMHCGTPLIWVCRSWSVLLQNADRFLLQVTCARFH